MPRREFSKEHEQAKKDQGREKLPGGAAEVQSEVRAWPNLLGIQPEGGLQELDIRQAIQVCKGIPCMRSLPQAGAFSCGVPWAWQRWGLTSLTHWGHFGPRWEAKSSLTRATIEHRYKALQEKGCKEQTC